jgi:hypothetical protein
MQPLEILIQNIYKKKKKNLFEVGSLSIKVGDDGCQDTDQVGPSHPSYQHEDDAHYMLGTICWVNITIAHLSF